MAFRGGPWLLGVGHGFLEWALDFRGGPWLLGVGHVAFMGGPWP